MDYDANRALQLLRIGSGVADATFRAGQENAIRHVVEGRGKLLVVQKTGWGKSFVYFIATKLLREGGAGPALLISPLLSLMRNQIAAAERMGIRAATINSANTAEWDAVETRIQNGIFSTRWHRIFGPAAVWYYLMPVQCRPRNATPAPGGIPK